MLQNFDEKIKKLNHADEVLNVLLEMLGYYSSPNFHFTENDEDFDAEYVLEIENLRYTLLGIKVLRDCDEGEIARQHLKYWNRNDVPFAILALPNEIRIYNNFTIGKQKLLYKTGTGKREDIDIFTDSSIANGILWKKIKAATSKNKRVDRCLLESLRNTILVLHRKYGMQPDAAYNLLAQCIFIRYLEDRKMLTETAFEEYGVKDFNGLLCLENAGCIQDFFSKLKNRFNGDLFDLDNIIWPDKGQIRVIQEFFAAEEIYEDGTVQFTFLKYDFSQIPIELISNIYETFFNLEDSLQNKKYSSQNGAFYTPYYLADFMNDRCMEKFTERRSPIVMDPACGSGVFLVGAFKRIVERQRRENGSVQPEELRQILLNNVYGVDKNIKALKLTCFSLYVALLEYLTPKDILENGFKFPNLIGQTLFEKNFFEKELADKGIKADIIIGNPPWLSDKDNLHNEYCKKRNIPISDKQIAQAFVVRAEDFASDNAIISLIVTNSIFVNELAEKYRQYILENYKILEVFNLYGIKNMLFSHAKAPCSILTYNCKNEEREYSFDYFSFKTNMIASVFQKIVYDTERIIKIKNTYMMSNPYVWRVLNNGDEYDVRVIGKMKMFPPVSMRGYSYFRGYAVGNRKLKRTEFLEHKGGNLQEGYAPYLIDYEVIPQMKETEFERPRPIKGYLCKSKLLIKRTQNERLSGAAFCGEPLIFCDDFHCLYDIGGKKEKDLKILEAFFNSGIFKYYRFFASKEAISIKKEISKGDIFDFPVPVDISEGDKERLLGVISSIEALLKKKYEQILTNAEIDTKIKMLEDRINEIVFDLYRLDEIERAAVQYALEYIIPGESKEPEMVDLPLDTVYTEYVEYIENYFNNFLDGSGLNLQNTQIISKNFFTLISFSVSKDSAVLRGCDADVLKNMIDILGLSSISNIDSELIVKKRLAGFLKDGFFVIKEKEIRNWTLMSAIKDADYFARIIIKEEDYE